MLNVKSVKGHFRRGNQLSVNFQYFSSQIKIFINILIHTVNMAGMFDLELAEEVQDGSDEDESQIPDEHIEVFHLLIM